MKVRILTIFTMVLLVSAVLAPSAMAQSCGSADELAYGYPSLSPTQGPAGSSFTVTGTAATVNSDVGVWWDVEGSPQFMDTLVMDAGGNYSGDVTAPADAADGTYTVSLLFTTGEYNPPRFTFPVAAAVQTDAYTPAIAAQGETPSVLPSTGLMLLVPAAGLASAGIGGLMLRRRKG